MKTIYATLITIALFAMNPIVNAQNFYLAPNGVTCMCPDAAIGDTGVVNGITYTKRVREQITAENASTSCTSGITNMQSLFLYESFFNLDISSWDTSSVTNMRSMFRNAYLFNRPLNHWDVSNVTDMSSMFEDAGSFNQDLSAWTFNPGVNLETFLSNANLSVNNYDLLLQSFLAQNLQNKNLEAELLGYCDTLTRDQLINNNGWSIQGDVIVECGAVINPSTTPFVTTWTVDGNDLTIDLFTRNIYEYNFDVDWGDGSTSTNVTQSISHTYTSPGTYTVSILGVYPYFMVCKNPAENPYNSCSNVEKLTTVQAWGDQEWQLMHSSFKNAENFTMPATDVPDLSQVKNMRRMFYEAGSFNEPIDNWDVSSVTDMSEMFRRAHNFNQPLNNWDVSNVTNMTSLFEYAGDFNQPLNNWDVSSVTDMSRMFDAAFDFNQPLNNWDVSSVTDMSWMFYFVVTFNQPLNSWDVSNVTDMSGMFYNARSFNQPLNNWNVSNVMDMRLMFSGIYSYNEDYDFNGNISNWDVSSVTNMNGMFRYANLFNQPINNWDVSNVTDMSEMFRRASSFDQPLNDWDVSSVTDMSEMLGAFSFNQPLNDWDVSNVTTMQGMFGGAYSFNQPLDNWNVSNVTNMTTMFSSAHSFNQQIHLWDVSNVINMEAMFRNAHNFLKNISLWCVEQIPNEPSQFASSCPIPESYKPIWGFDCSLLSTQLVDNPQIDIKLYPNPTSNVFTLDNKSEYSIETITILNMQGQVVKQVDGNQMNTQQINIQDLASGNYFIQIETNRTLLFKRLIKN